MTRLIVALDGSERSFEALRWGADLGERLDVDVQAVVALGPGAHTFFEPAHGGSSEEGLSAVVSAVEKALVDRGLPAIEVVAGFGHPADVLKEATDEPGVVGLVMGTRGLGTLPGLLLGSVSRKLLFISTHPLFMLPDRAGEAPALDHILVAVDGSPVSERIAEWAATMCARFGADATVIRCVNPGAELPTGHVDAYLDDVGALVDERWCAPFRDGDVPYEAMAARGDPRQRILEIARDRAAGLIIVAGRGEGQFQGLGGTTSYLVRHSSVPVAVLPSSADWEPAEL
jgi:nucleotide-binding universal stress UspA family protein